MSLPHPVPRLVIRHAYLWQSEFSKGQEEGLKDRPCAVILVTTDDDGEKLVTALPVTHTPHTIQRQLSKFRMQPK